MNGEWGFSLGFGFGLGSKIGRLCSSGKSSGRCLERMPSGYSVTGGVGMDVVVEWGRKAERGEVCNMSNGNVSV